MERQAKANITPVRQRTGGGYRVWCSDTHYYIGRSSNIEGRCRGHLKNLKKGLHINPHMQAVFNKYGMFRYEVLVVGSCLAATHIEQALLDEHLSNPLCMHICPSAQIPTRKGKKNSPEHNARISASRVGMVFDVEARTNMAAGQQRRFKDGWTPELREAMMVSRETPEYREKLSQALRGRSLSSEHRAKISAGGKGRVVSDQTRANLSVALKGRPVTDECCAKISEKAKGRKASPETRAKMREAQARRRASEKSIPEVTI